MIAAACRLSSVASLTAAVLAAACKLATEEVVTSRMIGSTMNASSSPPSSQVTTPNQPAGQLRADRSALRRCHVVIVPPGGLPAGLTRRMTATG